MDASFRLLNYSVVAVAVKGIFPLLEQNSDPSSVKNLIYKKNNEFIRTLKANLFDQDCLPPIPYDRLDSFYPIKNYLGKTFLGTKTVAF